MTPPDTPPAGVDPNATAALRRMRLWPAAPRPCSVRVAVKLMLAGAAAELAAMITVISTLGSVRATVAARDAAALQSVHLHQVTIIGLAPVAIGMWLWLAWANGRGEDWGEDLVSGAHGAALRAASADSSS